MQGVFSKLCELTTSFHLYSCVTGLLIVNFRYKNIIFYNTFMLNANFKCRAINNDKYILYIYIYSFYGIGT